MAKEQNESDLRKPNFKRMYESAFNAGYDAASSTVRFAPVNPRMLPADYKKTRRARFTKWWNS